MKLVIIDLDRTMFDTNSFHADLMAMVASMERGVNITELEQAAKQAELFDPFAVLRSLGVTHEQTSITFHNAYGDKSYLYPDVEQFITEATKHPDLVPSVLTTGNNETQRFKLSLCPELANLPQAVVQENKGAVLQRHFLPNGTLEYDGHNYDGLILVDDKATSFAPIEHHQVNFQGVQVIRPDSQYPTPSHHPLVTVTGSLIEATKVLHLDKA